MLGVCWVLSKTSRPVASCRTFPMIAPRLCSRNARVTCAVPGRSYCFSVAAEISGVGRNQPKSSCKHARDGWRTSDQLTGQSWHVEKHAVKSLEQIIPASEQFTLSWNKLFDGSFGRGSLSLPYASAFSLAPLTVCRKSLRRRRGRPSFAFDHVGARHRYSRYRPAHRRKEYVQ